jgi:hypothetical protein
MKKSSGMYNRIKEANTVEDLEALNIGRVIVDVSPRGGGLGFSGETVAEFVGVPAAYLPRSYGCGCNYLGGGMRGAIFASGYSKAVENKAQRRMLDAIAEACIRAYVAIEDEAGLNATGDDDWDAEATRRARATGAVSAY